MYASNRPTLGRRMLMTDEREITKDNIISVVSKAFMEHQENVAQEVFLFEYEKGNQPILNREKKINSHLKQLSKLGVNFPDKILADAIERPPD